MPYTYIASGKIKGWSLSSATRLAVALWPLRGSVD